MPTITYSAVDPIDQNPSGVKSATVKVVTQTPVAGLFRTADGVEVLSGETKKWNTDPVNGFPTTVSLELLGNADITPTGTHYAIQFELSGGFTRHAIVVPTGSGTYRLVDLLTAEPAASEPFVVGFTPAGTWDEDTTYHLREVVAHDGASYVARETTTGVEPGTDEAVWQVVAARGDNAVDSVNGRTGAVTGLAEASDVATKAPAALPAHAGVRAGRFDPSRSVYRDGLLRRFPAKLAAAATGDGLCRITWVGDSLTAGLGSTPGVSDPVTYLRGMLRSDGYRVGSLVWLSNLITPDARVAFSGTWNPGTDGFPWVEGHAATDTLTVTFTDPGTVLEIVSSGQSAAWSYSVDGGAPVTFAPNGVGGAQVVTVTGLADTTHTVKITAAASGNTYISAVGLRPASGVSLLNAGMSGTTTQHWINDTVFYGQLPAVNALPADLALVELGMNDFWQSVSVADYVSRIGTIVDTLRAAGSEVLLVASHRPSGGDWVGTYAAALYGIADSKAAPLLDLADVFGTYAEYHALGLDSDGAHLLPAGNAAKARAQARALGIEPSGAQQITLEGQSWIGTLSAVRWPPLAPVNVDQRIAALSLVCAGNIAASNTDYWTIEIVRWRDGVEATIATRTTQTTAPNGAVAAYVPWTFDLIAFSGSQYLSKGDTLGLKMTPTGSPAAWPDASVSWRYEPGVTA